ncbi:MAG: N-6 DNA methylase [Acetobacter sp.]|nr:N-6 DNA methylase [Acetobacter sp.]
MMTLEVINREMMESISSSKIAQELNVSAASVNNWIKAGYLERVGRGLVSRESYKTFCAEMVGSQKLNKRANKQYQKQHTPKVESFNFGKLFTLSFNEVVGETLSQSYEKSLSSSHKNKEGIYYTPLDVCRDFFSEIDIDINDGTRFCDPCCGSGNFIIAALEAGISPKNITGFDVDPIAVEIAKRRFYEYTGCTTCDIRVEDFLEMSCVSEGNLAFDIVMTNPPWGKKISRERRERISQQLGFTEAKDTLALVLAKAMLTIKPCGYVGFLMPDAFFYVAAFRQVRELLLDWRLTSLHDYGNIFSGVQAQAKSVIACKAKPFSHTLVTCKTKKSKHERLQESFKSNPESIINFEVDANESRVLMEMMSREHDTLKGRASWGLGIVTGNNKKFIANVHHDGYIPVYKGSEINSKYLGRPTCFIPDDMTLYQQVAPRQLYESQEKLIYRFICSELVFYFDTNKTYILNSANMLVVEKNFPVNMKKLSAYLNSKIISWFHKKMFQTYKVLRSNLEQIPIYSDFLNSTEKFCEESFLEYLGIGKNEKGYFMKA